MKNKTKQIETHWEVWTYEVWGNAKDGYDVNDKNCIDRDCLIMCKVTINNLGTIREFESCAPSDYAIKQALGLKKWVRINTDGDDIVIYVEAAKDGYPIGELRCISHESLSPIRAK